MSPDWKIPLSLIKYFLNIVLFLTRRVVGLNERYIITMVAIAICVDKPLFSRQGLTNQCPHVTYLSFPITWLIIKASWSRCSCWSHVADFARFAKSNRGFKLDIICLLSKMNECIFYLSFILEKSIGKVDLVLHSAYIADYF